MGLDEEMKTEKSKLEMVRACVCRFSEGMNGLYQMGRGMWGLELEPTRLNSHCLH